MYNLSMIKCYCGDDMKKVVKILICSLIIFLISGCGKKTDALKFKEEYENLNGETTESGKRIREIKISEENPFVYISTSDLLEKINNKETFLVYFGYASCPWCRSAIPTLISALKDFNIEKIYYVNLYYIRDVLKVSEGKIITEKEGTSDYKKILERLDNVLDEYTLMDGEKELKTGEKRIYAPSVVSIVKGKSTKLTLGISELQTDAYMDLSEEMIEESYSLFEDVIKEVSSSDTCEIGSNC